MKRILTSVLSIGAVSLFIGAATFATFTASATNSGNVFTTGNLVLSTSNSSGFISASNMKPGDTVNATLNVINGGSLNMTYNGTAAGTNPTLDPYLEVSVYDTSNSTIIAGPTGVNSLVIPNRNVNHGLQDQLTFHVQLLDAGNTVQNQTSNVTFNFSGSQL